MLARLARRCSPHLGDNHGNVEDDERVDADLEAAGRDELADEPEHPDIAPCVGRVHGTNRRRGAVGALNDRHVPPPPAFAASRGTAHPCSAPYDAGSGGGGGPVGRVYRRRRRRHAVAIDAAVGSTGDASSATVELQTRATALAGAAISHAAVGHTAVDRALGVAQPGADRRRQGQRLNRLHVLPLGTRGGGGRLIQHLVLIVVVVLLPAHVSIVSLQGQHALRKGRGAQTAHRQRRVTLEHLLQRMHRARRVQGTRHLAVEEREDLPKKG